VHLLMVNCGSSSLKFDVMVVDATIVDDDVLQAVTAATVLAPLHNRPALAAFHASRDVLGDDMPMVAVFDTAFHATMPDRASRYAIDHRLADRHDVRRYGFHGLAHRSMVERVAALSAVDAASRRMVTLQLGNGCSATAVDVHVDEAGVAARDAARVLNGTDTG
jgi:acetate kinase